MASWFGGGQAFQRSLRSALSFEIRTLALVALSVRSARQASRQTRIVATTITTLGAV